MKTLLIDRDRDIRELMATILESDGFEIATIDPSAHTIAELQTTILDWEPALVVCGTIHSMDAREVWGFARGLKSSRPDLVVVLLTTSAKVAQQARAPEQNGCVDATVLEPFELDGLLEVLHEALSRGGRSASGLPGQSKSGCRARRDNRRREQEWQYE